MSDLNREYTLLDGEIQSAADELKENMWTIINQELSRKGQTLAAELSKNKDRIQSLISEYLTEQDVETVCLFDNKSSTWSVPVLCFVIICVLKLPLTRKLKELDSDLVEFIDLNEYSKHLFSLKSEYNNRLQDLINHMEGLKNNESQNEDWYKQVLDRAHVLILDHLVPIPVLDEFKKGRFLPNSTIRDILELPRTTDKNRSIVKLVRQKDADGYEKFKEILVKTNQGLLRKCLENIERNEDTKELEEQLEMIEISRIEEELSRTNYNTTTFPKNEEIDERLTLQGSTEHKTRECCDTIKKVIEQGRSDDIFEQIVTAIDGIKSTINAKVNKASVASNNVVVLSMVCSSVEEVRQLLKVLQGEDFKRSINKLTEAFAEKYEEPFGLQAKIEIEKIRVLHENLRNQGIIGDTDSETYCEKHGGEMRVSKYFCPVHGICCCMSCANTTHRACHGIRKRIRYQESEALILHHLQGVGANGLCILPNEEILLCDNVNKRLTRLDNQHLVDSHCDLPDLPVDICVVGPDKVLVSFGTYVHFVDVNGIPTLDQKLFLDHVCMRLAWRDNCIYYSDRSSLYRCNNDGTDEKLLYTFGEQK